MNGHAWDDKVVKKQKETDSLSYLPPAVHCLLSEVWTEETLCRNGWEVVVRLLLVPTNNSLQLIFLYVDRCLSSWGAHFQNIYTIDQKQSNVFQYLPRQV